MTSLALFATSWLVLFAADADPADDSTGADVPTIRTRLDEARNGFDEVNAQLRHHQGIDPGGMTPPPIRSWRNCTNCGGVVGNRLQAGETLLPGEMLFSQDYMLVFQLDGNLAVRRVADGRALWTSGTDGRAHECRLQFDGNLVIRDRRDRAIWNARVSGQNGAILYVQNDGNVVIRSPAGALRGPRGRMSGGDGRRSYPLLIS